MGILLWGVPIEAAPTGNPQNPSSPASKILTVADITEDDTVLLTAKPTGILLMALSFNDVWYFSLEQMSRGLSFKLDCSGAKKPVLCERVIEYNGWFWIPLPVVEMLSGVRIKVNDSDWTLEVEYPLDIAESGMFQIEKPLGIIPGQALEGIRRADQWYFPLQEMARAFSFPLNCSPISKPFLCERMAFYGGRHWIPVSLLENITGQNVKIDSKKRSVKFENRYDISEDDEKVFSVELPIGLFPGNSLVSIKHLNTWYFPMDEAAHALKFELDCGVDSKSQRSSLCDTLLEYDGKMWAPKELLEKASNYSIRLNFTNSSLRFERTESSEIVKKAGTHPTEDDERIYEVMLVDGTVLDSGLVALDVLGERYLPLEQLSQALSLSIRVSPSLQIAQGFIVSEFRKFSLDSSRCYFQYLEKRTSFDCRQTFLHRDDIYVHESLVKKILPIKMEWELLRSRLIVVTQEPLPLQLARQREEQAGQLQSGEKWQAKKLPSINPQYSFLDGWSLDEQVGVNKRFDQPAPWGVQHSSILSGEVFGMESKLSTSGTQDGIDRSRLTLSSRASESEVFSPLGLKQMDLIHINLPPTPLIAPSLPGTGFLISQFPINAPTQFGKHNITGYLDPGWEVALYQNGLLIGRLTDMTRYEFKDIPLFYGRNQFHLAFFGPQGQRRDEYRTVPILGSLVPENRWQWRMGSILTDTDLQLMSYQLDFALSKEVTVTTGLLGNSSDRELHSWLGFYSFLGENAVSSICAFDKLGGKACELKLNSQLFPEVMSSLEIAKFSGYRSLLYNQPSGSLISERASVEISHPTPLLANTRMAWNAATQFYESGTQELSLTNQMSGMVGPVFWLHELLFQSGFPANPTGKLDINFSPWNMRLNLVLEYNLSAMQTIGVEAQTRLSQYVLQSQLRHQVLSGATSVLASVSRSFSDCFLGVNGTFTNSHEFSLGVQLGISLLRDPNEKKLHLTAESQASLGSASVFVFYDRNRNGERDADDPVVPRTAILVGSRSQEYLTNDAGVAFIPQLEPYQRVQLAISLTSISSPFLKPSVQGVALYPRPGKTLLATLPIVFSGEVSGSVEKEINKQRLSKRGQSMELLDRDHRVVKSTETDRDGFYQFGDLTPGDYFVRVGGSAAQSTPAEHLVKITEDDAIVSADFMLNSE